MILDKKNLDNINAVNIVLNNVKLFLKNVLLLIFLQNIIKS